MSDHIDPTPTSSPLGVVDEILAVVTAEEPRGATADQITIAIGLGFDGTLIRDTLEELVDRGLLNQFGIGHGTSLHAQSTDVTSGA